MCGEDKPGHYASLAAVRQEAFARIERGVSDRRSSFHTPVLVTNGLDGFPNARTVVLRGFDAHQRHLAFHTDSRSRKVAELMADNRGAAVFYDAGEKIQIRVLGTCQVHCNDELSHRAWDRLPAFSRRCYLGEKPGAVSEVPTSGLPSQFETRTPKHDETDMGLTNFAVIHLSITVVEWLYLSAKGHRRARLSWHNNGREALSWLSP